MMTKTRQHGTRLLIVCLVVGGSWQPAFAGGKSCGRCGSHQELKSVYRLVKICQEIDMPEYALTKQEAFYPDKGAVCHSGYRCDTFHALWRNCDCTIGCQSHTICDCKTLYGAKSTGHHAACAVRQPFEVSKRMVPLLRWEIVQRCQDCCEEASQPRKK